MLPPPRTAPIPPPAAPASGTARWLNLVTTTVLGAVVLVVVAAATPSLLRAGMSAADEPGDFPPPVRGHHPTLVPRDHPPRAFAFDDDPPDDEPDRPRAVRPTDPRAAAPRLPGQDREDDDCAPERTDARAPTRHTATIEDHHADAPSGEGSEHGIVAHGLRRPQDSVSVFHIP